MYQKLKRHPKAQRLEILGLSFHETNQLLLHCLADLSVKSIHSMICENIFRRSGGNPLFTRSLIIAVKELGQWKVVDGQFQMNTDQFDFEHIVLGYDLQGIIVAQLDRIDRNFQLFLKVAAVLGQKFMLEDVLFFLQDMTGFSEFAKPDNKRTIHELLRQLEKMDR